MKICFRLIFKTQSFKVFTLFTLTLFNIGTVLAIKVRIITVHGGRHGQKTTGNLFDLPAFYRMRIAAGRLFNKRHSVL